MEKIRDFINKYYIQISVVILAMSIVPFVVISYYSRPCIDDYNFSYEMLAMMEREKITVLSVLKAAFETDMNFYKSWNGLYTSGFLQAMQPGSYLGERNYYVGTIFLLVLMFAGSYYFSKTILRISNYKLKPILPATILFSFFIHGMINTCQGLYWWCGACDYITFINLTMINISLVLNYYFDEKNSVRYILLSMLVSFINSGGNHITAFLNILILLVLSVVCVVKKKKYGVLVTLATAIGGFLLVVFAPGTRVRMGEFEQRSIIETITKTAERFINLLLSKDYMMNFRFVIYLALLIMLGSMIKDNRRLKSLNINPIVLFLLFSMFQCGMLAVPYYAMGTFGAGRIKNIIWMAFMIFTGVYVLYCVTWLCNKNETINNYIDKVKNYNKKPLVIIACIALVLFSKNMYSVVQELLDGTAKTFGEQYNERYELMKKHKGTKEIVYVDEVIDSKNLKFLDITTDVNYWSNIWWSDYYHVPTALKAK